MRQLFTDGVVDHNPNPTRASDSFHDAGISLIQHREMEVDGQEDQSARCLMASKNVRSYLIFQKSIPPSSSSCAPKRASEVPCKP
ncbi:hypothetical protein PoB_001437400 [Plakobranchus ocellatus]|uniref:Uncharacterized protein n=1 Tax=Plakobranchus ocellatus TaxID=259542 RepID=A0AAV3YXU1_9GAST|nr:hypothetical protein PoB_001437400 [Plakobranchus ocellatus]